MKKKRKMNKLFAVLIFQILSFLFLAVPLYAEKIVGKFTALEGTVDVLRGGKLPAVLVKVGDPVYEKDVIRTKRNSKAEITFVDGNLLGIGPSSRVDISEYLAEEVHRAKLNLVRGTVRTKIEEGVRKKISASPEKHRFEIRTPIAVAGVRGTTFFSRHGRGMSWFWVREGSIGVYNLRMPEAVTEVGAGQMTTVTERRPPSFPVPAPERDLRWLERETSVGRRTEGAPLIFAREEPFFDLTFSRTETLETIFPQTLGETGFSGTEVQRQFLVRTPPPITETEPTSLTQLLFFFKPSQPPPSQPPPSSSEPSQPPPSQPPPSQPPPSQPPPSQPPPSQPPPSQPPPSQPPPSSDGGTVPQPPSLSPVVSLIEPYVAYPITILSFNGTSLSVAGNLTGTIYKVGTTSFWLSNETSPQQVVFNGTLSETLGGSVWFGLVKKGMNATDLFEGGAFKGFLAGTKKENKLSGSIIGIYVRPESQTGILRFYFDENSTVNSNFSLSGSAYPEATRPGLGLSPTELVPNTTWYESPGIFVKSENSNISGLGIINTLAVSNSTPGVIMPWGVYFLVMGGNSSTPLNNTASVLKFGGEFTHSYDNFTENPDFGFMIGEIDSYFGSNGYIQDGNLSGKFITKRLYGTLSGDLKGTHSNTFWEAVSLGTWEGSYLRHGNVYNATNSYYAILGGNSSFYNAPSSEVTLMGKMPSNGIFVLPSFNRVSEPIVTFYTDESSYLSFIGGYQKEDFLNGTLLGIFKAPDNQTGIIYGNLAGVLHQNLSGLLEMNGTIYPVYFNDATLSNLEDIRKFFSSSSTIWFSSGTFLSGDNISVENLSYYDELVHTLTSSNFGVFRFLASGSYTGTPSNTWEIIKGSRFSSDSGFVEHYLYFEGEKWSDGLLRGRFYGGKADLTSNNPYTGIVVGETLGVFDANSWSAINLGTFIETTRFLEMTKTDEGRNVLQKLNIPSVEIGKITLSGTKEEGSTTASVSLNEVTFFAPYANSKPKIWATGSVSGTNGFSSPVEIPISSGNGLSGKFSIVNWSEGKWSARIDSSGSVYLNGYSGSLEMGGVSAGKIGENNNFSGTASGWVK